VRDRREVLVNGEVLCKPCAHGTYFEDAHEITWPEMSWTPASEAATGKPRRKPQVLDPEEIKKDKRIFLSHAETAPH
jgi:hypothetical protein